MRRKGRTNQPRIVRETLPPLNSPGGLPDRSRAMGTSKTFNSSQSSGVGLGATMVGYCSRATLVVLASRRAQKMQVNGL